MAANSPAPIQAPPSPRERVTNFLGWAFLISIAIHLVFGPILGRYNPSHAQEKEVEKVSLSKKVKVVVPTPPPPTPTPPPPTPQPKSTPPPVKATNPPPAPKLKVEPPKTNSNSGSGPTEKRYNVQQGSQNGIPQGTVASAAPAPAAPANTAPPAPPAPTPTPKPACANPHVDATTTNPVTPDTPEMAKQQGATGTVQVKVSLSATGSVLSAAVYKSSGFPMLDQAALQAAKQSSYAPEIDQCVKVAGDYIFRADFEGN